MITKRRKTQLATLPIDIKADSMQIERAMLGVTTLGPGNRMAIWVNGCLRRCRGCVSPELQCFNPQNEQEIESFFSEFSFKDVDGVTVSGGEPFEQIAELQRLVDYMLQRNIDDILIYTGYTYEQLKAKEDTRIDDILSKIAVLVDGEYVAELDDDKCALRGSTNQRVIIINDKYNEQYQQYLKTDRTQQILDLGFYVLAVGIPTKGFLAEFKK